MQQEDDLRALAKIMEFGRAVSIFLLVVHVYVYCYPSITAWHLNLAVMDRILVNFNNTTGIFNCILWSKLLAVLLLAVSCLGTHGVKGEKITWPKIYAALVAGCALFFLNWWLLELPLPHAANTAFYIFYSYGRLSRPADVGAMDEPPLQAQPHGRCVQYGK